MEYGWEIKIKYMGSELKFYFTFGQQHVHPKTGEPMKNYFVEVIMHDDYLKLNSMEISLLKERARQIMFKRYGRKWSMQYDEQQFNESYFPGGCYQTLYYPLPDDIEIKVENEIVNKFSVGDMVIPNSRGKKFHMDDYFENIPRKVIKLIDYADESQGVGVVINNKELVFLSDVLQKID